ncbi:molecular chaperone Tir [Noviherbaspirillum cavernae]|uniref:Molecular chaperone Tir n=1 Tax=Noviherbaspirillum cavernae TaxID=2320862 RepID=A0A418X569_9BURK|nr:CesT family type III secretion system chaperone [Noviherbaspirillum cavernae]RJG07546.1 molecular chaperone Tir [Noviherbaspirillum cavernae]
MSKSSYSSLIEGFCKRSWLDDPASVMRGGPVEVNEVKFSLIYSEKINADMLFIYCDFGDPPVGRERDVYRALLKKNLFLYKGDGPVFAISPDTGRIMLARHERLDALTPDILSSILTTLSSQANAWRKEPLSSEEEMRQTTPASRSASSTSALLARAQIARVSKNS